MAALVDEDLAVGQPVGDVQRAVAEPLGQHLADRPLPRRVGAQQRLGRGGAAARPTPSCTAIETTAAGSASRHSDDPDGRARAPRADDARPRRRPAPRRPARAGRATSSTGSATSASATQRHRQLEQSSASARRNAAAVVHARDRAAGGRRAGGWPAAARPRRAARTRAGAAPRERREHQVGEAVRQREQQVEQRAAGLAQVPAQLDARLLGADGGHSPPSTVTSPLPLSAWMVNAASSAVGDPAHARGYASLWASTR